MRNVVIAFTLVLTSFGILSFKRFEQPAPTTPPLAAGIQWISWEEMMDKAKSQPRKVVVDVFTDWCGWCKRMDASTFQDPALAKYINEHYYAVKFNAEQKTDILFKGKTYKFVKNGMKGYHELAAEITKGRLSYPTLVFLDEKQEVIQSIPGFRDALELEKIATYFGRDEHTRTPWETYQKNYKPIARN